MGRKSPAPVGPRRPVRYTARVRSGMGYRSVWSGVLRLEDAVLAAVDKLGIGRDEPFEVVVQPSQQGEEKTP